MSRWRWWWWVADVVVVENTRGGARNPLDKQRSCKDHTDFVYRTILLRVFVYILYICIYIGWKIIILSVFV